MHTIGLLQQQQLVSCNQFYVFCMSFLWFLWNDAGTKHVSIVFLSSFYQIALSLLYSHCHIVYDNNNNLNIIVVYENKNT